MNIRRWATSFVALLCLLCLPVSLFAGCKGSSKIEVVFDMNWKEAASAPASIEVKEGEPYGQLPQIADNVREGYTFGGWYLDSDCDGEEVTAETVVTSSVSHVLYAKWIGNKITVSFDLQGGTINGVSNVEDAVVTVGNVYSMMAIPEDPEKESHSFMGWYYDPEGTEGPVRTSTKVEKTEDHTLYAIWQEYQLFYDFENGTGLEILASAGNIQYGIEHYNGSDQLNISNPGTDKADGTALQMWIPLKTGTRVTMDLTFAGELPSEDARMYMFGYGMNASGIAITDGLLDITESETHRKWYHGNGYRAMQKDGVWYYGDEGNWHEGNTCKFEMIVMEDCAGLYLTFSLGSELESAQFAKNDIYIDNIEFTPNYYRVLGEGMMGSSPHAATDKGIYFTMRKNDTPYDSDWQIYYDATSADNIKIIRNGKVYRIAQTNCDNIVKWSETDYYLRLEEYTIGAAAPISNKDIFIVEGDFSYEGNTITIKKTYIYHDGVSWVFVDQLPAHLAPASEQASDFPDPYYGILRTHEGGATDSGIHFKLSDNGLPFGKDWDVYYDATTTDNIKIIRDGKVYRAAQVGCDNICKFGKDSYYLRLEAYTIGSYWPFNTEDIFIVEGKFQYEKSILNINKTYIYHNGSDWVFATKLPAALAPESEVPVEPEVMADGMMGSSPNGATDQGIYFTMKDNGLPHGDWDVYYDATSADNIKVIRNGTAYSAAVVGCDNICKFSATDYYLRLENYTIGGYAPFSTEDIFVVEGDFTYEDSTLTIVKTYIYHNGTSWVFTTELPEDLQPGEGGEELGNNLGVLSAHNAGVNIDSATNSVKGIYATGAATSAPFNTDWSVEYSPAAAKNYQLIRDGVTYDVGVPGSGTIVLFGQTELYLKQEPHTFGDGTLLPIRDGDILVVKGEWICNQDASATVTITKTCILISEGTATFYEGEPDEDGGEEEQGNSLGVLSAHDAGVNIDSTTNSVKGVYATGAATNAIYNSDWSVEYTPAAAKNYQLIRDGVTYDVGVPGSGTIVLFGQTELYLKQESHTFGDGTLLPIRDGDILVVKGEWICNQDASSAITITKTCILISGDTATFYAGEPDEEGGEDTENSWLYTHTYGVNMDAATNSVKGIYAMCQDNDATFNTDWSVEYTPAAAENYKLIRNGVTYNVGVVGNGTIVLFGQTELYLKQEAHTVGDGTLLPIRDGDILVVEGQWNCIQDASSTLTIDTTYILISGNTAVFSAKLPGGTLPDEDEPTDTQWPFNFDDGQVSTDIFKLRDSDLDMTVEELGGSMQLRLQPTVANGKYWLWLAQDLKAGTVITMDVTFQRKLGTMSLYLYGANENGDPITEGTASDTVPQIWFNGQGVDADFTGGNTNTQTVTFTVYEDCHGIAFMLGYGNKKPNVIYLDNITSSDTSAGDTQGNALGVLSDHYGGANIDSITNTVKGIYATVQATSAIFSTDWSVEYTPAKAENYQMIRDGVTYNVGVPGQGTIVLFGQTELYLKQEAHTVGDGTLLPVQDGDILVVEGQWNCIQDSASVFTITKTYILIEDGTVKFSAEQP